MPVTGKEHQNKSSCNIFLPKVTFTICASLLSAPVFVQSQHKQHLCQYTLIKVRNIFSALVNAIASEMPSGLLCVLLWHWQQMSAGTFFCVKPQYLPHKWIHAISSLTGGKVTQNNTRCDTDTRGKKRPITHIRAKKL